MKQVLAILVIAGWWPFSLSAQGTDTGWEKLATAFEQMVDQEQSVQAHSMLAALIRSDSSRSYLVADPATRLLATPTATHRQVDTLRAIYRQGAIHDARRQMWLVREALLSIRYPDFYYQERDSLCRQALLKAPLESPLLVTESFTIQAVNSYRARTGSLKDLAEAWLLVDQQLLLREVLLPESASETAALRSKLQTQVRNAIPDCQELERLFARAATESEAAQVLTLFQLQACWNSPGWEAAGERLLRYEPLPWHHRHLAERALHLGNPERAAYHWEQAIQHAAAQPELKALYYLQLAEVLATQNDFRAARKQIQQAMTFHPHWGEPYMRLCNLYLQGAEHCDFNSFDRGALHWLLIDLCQEARNVDPSYDKEAGRRIFQYQQASPDSRAISFRGLREGDTWPLKCWMSTVTTVKVK